MGSEGGVKGIFPRRRRREVEFLDVLRRFDHELEHESAHFTAISVLGGVVVEQGDVGGALQQRVEIIGVDGDLVVDGREVVSLANRVGDERRVADAFRHIPFVGREHENVLEIEVSRLKNAHDLQSLGRFAVEGNRGRLDELVEQSAERGDVAVEVAVIDERFQSVDERVGAEKRLLEERVVVVASLGADVVQDVGKS